MINRSLLQTRFLSNEVRSAIDKAVASAPVVLFMKGTPETPQCGFSRTSIQILGMQGVDPTKFTAFNVLEDQELRDGRFYGATTSARGRTQLQLHEQVKRLTRAPARGI